MQHTRNKESQEILDRISKKAEKVFGFKIEGIRLVIFKDFSYVCKILNLDEKKLPSYAVGFFKDNTVFVLDKSLFPDRGHDIAEFEGVVLHELCHIYFKRMFKTKIPIWIELGFCNYISFPETKPTFSVELKNLNTIEDWYKHNSPYVYCSAFFYFLEKKCDKDNILKFLNLLKKHSVENAFLKAFNFPLNVLEKEYEKVIGE